MTKKEIIIKAWMDLNIETPFGICDKTGWVHGYFCNGIDDIINDYGDITDKIDYEIEYGGVGKFRPKSLKGIENNNGWIWRSSSATFSAASGLILRPYKERLRPAWLAISEACSNSSKALLN